MQNVVNVLEKEEKSIVPYYGKVMYVKDLDMKSIVV